MTPRVFNVFGKPPSFRDEALAAAAEALRAGQLVVAPTETLYGVFAAPLGAPHGGDDAATQALARATGRRGPWAWHAPSAQTVLASVPIAPGVAQRLVQRLCPGPATFLAPIDLVRRDALPAGLAAAVSATDAQAGAGELAFRVPESDLFLDLARSIQPRVIIGESVAALANTAGLRLDPADVPPEPLPGVAVVISAGRTRLGRQSTTIRLQDRGYQIAAVGALEPRFVRKQLERLVLFVCSGNTCRSPMAAAIARELILRSGGTLTPPPELADTKLDQDAVLTTTILSAGTMAGVGDPATPEALDALETLGVPRPAPPHRARQLSRELVAQADVIFAMTRGHLAAIHAIDPAAAHKALLLDPAAGDVPDPIGHPQRVYTAAAEKIRGMIAQRFQELGITPATAAASGGRP